MSKESERIQFIIDSIRRFPSVADAGLDASVPLGALDDCAVVPIGNSLDLVIGSDFVRGTEFYLFKNGTLTMKI